MKSTSQNAILMLVMISSFLALPPTAEARPATTQLRFFAAHIGPDLGFERIEQSDRITLTSRGTLGLGLGLVRRFSQRVGLDVSLRFANPRLTLEVSPQGGPTVAGQDRFALIPLTIAPTFHLLGERSIDLYLAPMLVYTFIGDVNFEAAVDGVSEQTNLRSDDDLSWGLAIGLDVPLGDDPWALSAVIEHLATQLDVLDLDDDVRTVIDLDPWVVRVGFGYRF